MGAHVVTLPLNCLRDLECLSLGHSNTFIPSTLAGSCINDETGKIDESKLRENLTLAISAYISRVDGCPCGDTTIKLFEGSREQQYHHASKKIEVFLKGSNKQKKALQKENPSLFSHFQKIWNIRNKHITTSSNLAYRGTCLLQTLKGVLRIKSENTHL